MSKKKQKTRKNCWADVPIMNDPERLHKEAEITVDFSALISKAANYKIKDKK